MHRILLCFLMLLIFVGCSKTKEQSPLEFELRMYEKSSKLNCFEGDCTEIEIQMPIVLKGESVVVKKINQTNLDFVSNVVSLGDTLINVEDYNLLIETYIKDYEDFITKYPDEELPWKATVSGDISYVSKALLSFTFEYYTFAGGAHGFKSEASQNFNPVTGELYRVDDLIVNWDGLQLLLFDKLRATSDFFDKIKSLDYPESIFFYEDSVIFLYNTFSLETFHADPVKLEFTKKEILPFLNITLDGDEVENK